VADPTVAAGMTEIEIRMPNELGMTIPT